MRMPAPIALATPSSTGTTLRTPASTITSTNVWLPLLFGLSSYICYTAGLPGDAIFDLKWATVFQGAAVALTAAALYRSLNEEKAEAALAEVKA